MGYEEEEKNQDSSEKKDEILTVGWIGREKRRGKKKNRSRYKQGDNGQTAGNSSSGGMMIGHMGLLYGKKEIMQEVKIILVSVGKIRKLE